MKIKKTIFSTLALSLLLASSFPITGNAKNSIDVQRTSGANRYETSINVSKSSYSKSDNIIIANGKNFADALSGVQLANVLNAPILLVPQEKIDTSTLNEVNRLEAKNVYILGGTSSVSQNIEKSFAGKKVTRLAGADRYLTSKIVMQETMKYGSFSEIVIASGLNYPDALSASSYIYKKKALMLLSDGNSFKIESDLNIVAIGGKNSLPLPGFNGKRIAGNDRYETALLIAKDVFGSTEKAILASGQDYPDALSAISMVKNLNAPILLSEKNNISNSLMEYLKNIKNIQIIGGVNSISENIKDILQNNTKDNNDTVNKNNNVNKIDKLPNVNTDNTNTPINNDNSKTSIYYLHDKEKNDPVWTGSIEKDLIQFKDVLRFDTRPLRKLDPNNGNEDQYINFSVISGFDEIPGLFILYRKFDSDAEYNDKLNKANIPTKEPVLLHLYLDDIENRTDAESSIESIKIGTVEKDGKKYYIKIKLWKSRSPKPIEEENIYKKFYSETYNSLKKLEAINGAKLTLFDDGLNEYKNNITNIELKNVLKTTVEVIKDDMKYKEGLNNEQIQKINKIIEEVTSISNKDVKLFSEDFYKFYKLDEEIYKIANNY